MNDKLQNEIKWKIKENDKYDSTNQIDLLIIICVYVIYALS